MEISETAAERVDPLTGDLITVKVSSRKADSGFREIPGKVVVPGLAITANEGDGKKPARYSLTHVPSGLAAGRSHCGLHAQEVAAAAVDAGIDWTVGKDAVVAAIKAKDGLTDALFKRGCSDWCKGDGPKPPSYNVRCNTCDWEWDDDEYDEGPLSREDAERMGMDHECEPWIEIKSPVTGKWHEKYALKDAEAKAASPATEG